jgi:hypothetical protein
VRTVEEEHPDWWDLFEAAQMQASRAGEEEGEASASSTEEVRPPTRTRVKLAQGGRLQPRQSKRT